LFVRAFGANLMYKVGGDPHAVGVLLLRVSGNPGAVPHFLFDHPQAQERADAIARMARPSPLIVLLMPSEWAALKSICTGG